jgi:hypothetical protein
VAIGLDRTHAGVVEHLRVVEPADAGGPLVVEVDGGQAGLETEVYSANERRGLLESVLGRDLRVDASARGAQGPDDGGTAAPTSGH